MNEQTVPSPGVPAAIAKRFEVFERHDVKTLGPPFTVPLADVATYCRIVGDKNPAHVVSSDNPFPSAVVPAAMIGGYIGRHSPIEVPYKIGDYVLVIRRLDIEFMRPLFADIEANFRCELLEAPQKTRMGIAFAIKLAVVVDGKTVARGSMNLLYARPGGDI